jgi:hypothetical protein
MSVNEVSDILWQERHLLELLLFKLEEEQLVQSSGSKRWLTHAAREVELVLDEIKRAEVARVVEVDAAAAEMGLSAGLSLRELTEASDGPWWGVFEEHRRAFAAITQEISALTPVDADHLARARQATEEALAWLDDGEPDTHADAGDAASSPSDTPRLVNDAS